MKRIRKMLAWLLAAIMVLTALPVGVLAEEKDAPGDETPLCTCETACAEGSMNTECLVCGAESAAPEDCGKYQAPEQDGAGEEPGDAAPQEPSAVKQVQAMLDALPTAEELADMSQEEQGAVYEALQAAYDAYEALSDAEKMEVTGAEIFDALFAVFNGMTNFLADSAFSITGGTANADYTYSNGVLTVNNGADITISMADGATTPTSDRIVVNTGASASITLNGVNITGAGTSDTNTTTYSAITLSPNSSLTLTLAQGSSNTLAGGSGGSSAAGAPAIRISAGTMLTVLCENGTDSGHICGEDCGALIAEGGNSSNSSGGVGIGGGVQDSGPLGTSSEGCGTVLLLGGNITVNGGNGQIDSDKAVDIGGASSATGTGGAGGTVIILTNVQNSSGSLNIGGGAQPGGNADNGAGIKPSTGDNTYEVYGNLSLPDNLTIPAGVTVTIPSGAALTVPSGKTLTNNGTIVNNGTITVDSGGTLTNNGDVSGSGSLTNNGTVTKKQQIATAPTADDVTAAETSITVKTVAGQKYACTASDTAPGTTDNCWQTATGSTMTFDNLTAGKTYYIWTYKPGNDYYADSDVVGTEINTVPSAPAASDVTINYKEETITFGDTLEVNTSENFDGTSIANNGSITDYIKDTENTIYVRVKGTGDTAASAATPVTIPARPAAPTTVQGGYEKLTGVTVEMQYSTDGTNWTDITGTEITGLTAGTYYVRYKATGKDFASYATNTVTVQADEIHPTGTITVNENSWKSFINTITFGIFCKDKYDVTITAADNETGVSSVEYLLSETAISANDITNQTDWQAYSEKFSIENAGKYIIYAKITDKAGNIAYISTDGMILDKGNPSEPTVSAATSDGSYTSDTWTNQDVTLTASGSMADSGIARYEYSADNGANWTVMTATEQTAASSTEPATITEAQLTISEAANTTYLIRAVSNTGGYSEEASVTVKIETTAPVIEGITDGETYCPNHTFTVSDANLNEVTINGTAAQAADGKYTLNTEGECTVTAADEAGNSVTYTVTVGHIWGETVSYEWKSDGSTCTAKRTCTVDSTHTDTAAATATGTVTTPPTCTEQGKTTYKAAFDVDWASPQETTIANISPKGHSLTGYAAKAATCTATGNVAYWNCSECHKNFDAAENGKELQTIVTSIDTNNHNPEAAWIQADDKHYHECQNGCGTHLDETACSGGTAACTAQAVCGVCGNAYGEKNLDNHTGDTEVRDAQPASCTADGYTGDTYCKACNTKIQTGSVIPQTGHNWDEPVWSWSEDGKTAAVTFTCKSDRNHTEQPMVTMSSTETPAGCTNGGEIIYKASVTFNNQEYTAQNSVTVPAKGHSYIYHEAVSAKCEQSGMKAYYTCENCDLIFDENKEVTTLDDLTIDATGHTFLTEWKTDAEKHWHECSCGAKTEEAAHTFQWKIDKEAEIGTAGTKHEECTVCGYAKAAVEIPALTAPEYPPVIGDTDGGQVRVSPEKPQEGDEVTITAKPEEGKAVDKVVVTDGKGKEISVTDNGDGTYIFVQPDGEVTIKVTFKTEKEEENRPTATPEPTEEPKPTATPTSTPSADKSSPQTSDSSDIMMWRMLLLAAGFGLAGTTIYGCRKRKHSK